MGFPTTPLEFCKKQSMRKGQVEGKPIIALLFKSCLLASNIIISRSEMQLTTSWSDLNNGCTQFISYQLIINIILPTVKNDDTKRTKQTESNEETKQKEDSRNQLKRVKKTRNQTRKIRKERVKRRTPRKVNFVTISMTLLHHCFFNRQETQG